MPNARPAAEPSSTQGLHDAMEASAPAMPSGSPWQFQMAFQPVVRLSTQRVVAHEALMRPQDGASPLRVLDQARRDGRLGEVEVLAARQAAAQFDFSTGGRLLVNLSAHAILQSTLRPQQVLETLQRSGHDLGRFVIEITERDIVENAGELAHALGFLRAAGVRIALDDFGNGHSNFELWHELAPEFVKLDKYLIHHIADSQGRLSIVKALVSVAESLGTELIAEGVERPEDLRIVQDLGIAFAQGYLLGRPSFTVAQEVPEGVFQSSRARLPVPPRETRPSGYRRINAAHLLIEAPSISSLATNLDAEQIFRANPQLPALPVVDAQGKPLGLLNRRVFNERMAAPFARELTGKKPCVLHMHASPVVCDVGQSIDEMSQILLGEDQRYLSDGFIITEQGRYRGVGASEALVRRVTELRIEAARYANPLTLLPGNIPITEHITRLLEGRQRFAAAYCDLNSFKPYNDQYGYFRGDRMIQLVASTLLRHADPQWDFVGHVGGDDFVVLLQSEDWEARCQRIVAEFNASAQALFEPQDLARGAFEGEDRAGRFTTFALTTLAIGVVCAGVGRFTGAEQIASLAASAKRHAKRHQQGLYVMPQDTTA